MKSILSIALIWLLVAVISALTFGTFVPQNWIGVLALLIFGQPIYILGEILGDWLWSTRPFRKISESPSRSIIIIGGVAIGFEFCIVLFAISTFITANHGI